MTTKILRQRPTWGCPEQ